MRTFGEFFDVVAGWASENNNGEAKLFLSLWPNLVTPEQWREERNLEIVDNVYYNFAADAVAHFRKRLSGIGGDWLYRRVTESGHAFLLGIIEKGREFGIEVDPARVDVPLSASDALVMAQEASAGHASKDLTPRHFREKGWTPHVTGDSRGGSDE